MAELYRNSMFFFTIEKSRIKQDQFILDDIVLPGDPRTHTCKYTGTYYIHMCETRMYARAITVKGAYRVSAAIVALIVSHTLRAPWNISAKAFDDIFAHDYVLA